MRQRKLQSVGRMFLLTGLWRRWKMHGKMT